MEIQDFITNFANQFDDTDFAEFSPDTNFRDLEEWSSLTALAVLNMIEKKYLTNVKANEMLTASTIQELFDLVKSKV